MSHGVLYNFFLGEKRTLMQSIVDGAIRSAFSGLVVAVAGLYLINSVEKSIELAEKKAAFKNLQNTALSEVILDISKIYGGLNCSREHFNLVAGACNNEIDIAITALNEHYKLLDSLFHNQDFQSVNTNIEILRKMKRLKNSSTNLSISHLMDKHSKEFANMINDLSENFQ